MKDTKSIKIIVCSLFCLLLLTGCIEKFEDNLPQEDSKFIVVDGTVCSDGICSIHLSRTRKLDEEIPADRDYYTPDEPVRNANVSVRGTDGSVYQLKSDYYYNEYLKEILGEDYNPENVVINNGQYEARLPKLNPNVGYYIRIETYGDVYESTPEKPVVTPEIEDITAYQPTEKSNIDILISTAKSENPNITAYYEWNILETSEIQPLYKSNTFFSYEDSAFLQDKELYPKQGWKYSQKTDILTSTVHCPNNQLQKFKLYELYRDQEEIFYNYSGLVFQRAISKGEYEYRLACRQTAEEMGGLFSPQASTPPSNIHCVNGSKRVIGYVGVSMNETEKRFYISGDDVKGKIMPPYPETIETIGPSYNETIQLLDQEYLVCRYTPPSYTVPKEIVVWAPKEYIDLNTRWDLTFYKPDFMP